MKFEKNSKYFTIAVYTVVTVLTIIVLTFLMFHLKAIGGYVAKFLGLVFRLLKPLLFGLIIAYLLEPIVSVYDQRCVGMEWLCKKKKVGGANGKVGDTRVFPTTLAFLTFIAFLGIIILILVINIRDVMGVLQQGQLSQMMDGYIETFKNMIENVDTATQNIPFLGSQLELVSKIYSFIEVFTLAVGEKIAEVIKNLGSQLMSIGLGIVVAFYMLKDKKKLLVIWRRFIKLIVPERIRSEVMDIGRDVDYVFSGYIRGQLIDATIMGTLISIVLTCIGIDFAVIIGIISGLFNLIPYFGPVVGFVLAGFIGFIGPEPEKGIYAILAVMALQQLDGWVIVPKVMGQTVKLHPIAVLLAIVIGGQLFGLIGFLLGVPLAGFIRLCIIRYMGDLFSGEEN